MASFIRLFESTQHASGYAKFRFTYPKELIDAIKVFIDRHGIARDVLVDVGCGSGQSIAPWSNVFKQCIGTDISQAQIDCARDAISCDNVEFHVIPSHNMQGLLKDGLVDLVTCGQAWHWLDHPRTIPEITRVLKTPGAVAIYGYGTGRLVNVSANEVFQEFYSGTLKGYWDDKRRHIDELYKNLPMIEPCEKMEIFDTKKVVSFSDFIGYISTWSGYLNYVKENPNNEILKTLGDKLQQSIGNDDVEFIVPFFLYLSRKT